MEPIVGKFHSKETFGTVDGPGIRYVGFLQGCALKCIFCHNPDTWDGGAFTFQFTVDEFVEDVLKYKNFIINGGVTFSGGEPLLQAAFIEQATDALHSHGIHVAIDTAGFVCLSSCRNALTKCDLVLLDIKALDAKMCKEITGQGNEPTLALLHFLEEIKKPVWIRHVLIPNWTLNTEMLENLASFLSNFSTIEGVELLPFHKLGAFKWKELNLSFSLKDTPVPTQIEVEYAKEIFIKRGFTVI